jgi:hypothetical protein
MAIAQDVIRRAYRLAGIIASGETPDAAMTQDAIFALNGMLAEWHSAQIGVPQYSVANEQSVLGTDAGDNEAIAYMLSLRMMPEFGISAAPEFAAQASESMSRLRLRYFQPGRMDFGELPVRIPHADAFDIGSGY